MTVALVVNLVANGMSTQDIMGEYPELEPEDIRQALQYASALGQPNIRAAVALRSGSRPGGAQVPEIQQILQNEAVVHGAALKMCSVSQDLLG